MLRNTRTSQTRFCSQREQTLLTWVLILISASRRRYHLVTKGAGVFGRPGQNMEDLFVFGTSRSSNELKSVPQPPCQLRLMKRYFWSHKICHLWLKIGLFKAMFGLFLQVFCSTDHIYAYFKLEMDQELPYTYGKVGWGHLAPLQVPF